MELREDNLMYLVDSTSPVDPTTTDACEWDVALIVNGEKLVKGTWELHPRSAVGMSKDCEAMFLIIEGRQIEKKIIGTTAIEVADILLRYDCAQAMLQDGGSSAIMVYHGEPVTMCSNGYETGRAIPNAWVVVPHEN
jgi:exopolysaccharide biosynthesis protein